jgi:beta-lactamase class A
MLSRTRLGLLTLSGLIFLMVLSHFFASRFHLPGVISTSGFNFDSQNIKQSDKLKKIVQDDLKDQKGFFAIYIEDLQDNERYQFNEVAPIPAASLYKLILMAAVFKQVEEGNLTLGQMVSGNQTHLAKVLGSEDYGYDEMSEDLSFSVEEALTRVATISDNYAAIMLTEKLRSNYQKDSQMKNVDPLTEMSQILGLRVTDFNGPEGMITTTAFDIGNLFKALYKGQVVSSDASGKILDLLSKSKISNRIPANLPKEVKVAHKTGELARIRHDAGIVYLNNQAYIIVMMSKDLQYEDDAIEVMAKISGDVYNYFSNKYPTAQPSPQ